LTTPFVIEASVRRDGPVRTAPNQNAHLANFVGNKTEDHKPPLIPRKAVVRWPVPSPIP